MPGRRKPTWSSNEYFAHKKNVGEEVKLKYEVTSIEKYYGFVKDSMKLTINEARTSLKNLRKSTGHSIDGLPPTPFQHFPERTSLVGIPPHDRVPTSLKELPPEYRYLEINDNEFQFNVRNVDEQPAAQDGSQLVSERNAYSDLNDDHQSGDGTDVTLLQAVSSHRHDMAISKSDRQDHDSWQQTKLPPLDHRGGDSLQSVRIPVVQTEKLTDPERNNTISRSKLELPLIQTIQNDDAVSARECLQIPTFSPYKEHNIYPQSPDNINVITRESTFTSCDSCDGLRQKDYLLLSPQGKETKETGQRAEENKLSPQSAIISDRVKYVKEENSTFTRQSGNNAKGQRSVPTKRKKTQAKDKEKQVSLRDIRTRCRTCQERFRQNMEFQKLKREKEQQERFQRQNSAVKTFPPKPKPFIISADDLESLKSDEVLDFDDVEGRRPPVHSKEAIAKRCAKGYSRKRMEQLAQPRTGRKRKLLFSKQLIRKEAVSLIESHSHPEMTEREKERLRMLESKIRMFLAMMQDAMMPSKMVDIPQREDIMKVDISHH